MCNVGISVHIIWNVPSFSLSLSPTLCFAWATWVVSLDSSTNLPIPYMHTTTLKSTFKRSVPCARPLDTPIELLRALVYTPTRSRAQTLPPHAHVQRLASPRLKGEMSATTQTSLDLANNVVFERFMRGEFLFHLILYWMKGSGGASKVMRQFPCSTVDAARHLVVKLQVMFCS